MKLKQLGIFAGVLSATLLVTAADWAEWRGSKADGIAAAETKWSSSAVSQKKVLWKKNVGKGWSAVAVKAGRLYTMGNVGNEDIIVCLDAKSGKEIWNYKYACKAGSFPGPRSTPVVDGNNVYTFSRKGDALCLDAKEGKKVWEANLIQSYGAKDLKWGLSGSPLVEGNAVIFNACQYGVALNKKTGKKLWASPGGVSGYATPVAFNVGKKRCVAIFGEKAIFTVDARTGRKVSSFAWETKYNVNAADPIVSKDQMFISSGYGRGCALLKMKSGKLSKVWENKALCNHFSTSILIDGHLYGCNGNTGKGNLTCVDMKSGREKWSHKSGFSSLVAAGGKLIVINEKSELFVCEAKSSGYKELAKTKLGLKGKCWTMPVISGSLIYCRSGNGDLVCVDVRK